MKKVYKTSFLTKTVTLLSPLPALLFIGLFINTCVDPFYAGNRLLGILFLGFFMLAFICLSAYGFVEMRDTVTLTDNAVKFHIHRQKFPPSLKAIDDHILRKDIREVSFYEPSSHSTVLLLKLKSGEVKEYDIGHMQTMLKYDIESRLAPKILDNKDFETEDDLLTDDIGPTSDGPGPIALSEKKTLLCLAGSIIVGIIGTVLIACDLWPVLGFILFLIALQAASFCLYRYNMLFKLHIDSKLMKKGRLITTLGAFLLLCLLAAAIIFLVR